MLTSFFALRASLADTRTHDTNDPRACVTCGAPIDAAKSVCFCTRHADEYDALPAETLQPCFVCRTPTPVDQLTACELIEWTSPARNARRTVQTIAICPLCESRRAYDEQQERAAQADDAQAQEEC